MSDLVLLFDVTFQTTLSSALPMLPMTLEAIEAGNQGKNIIYIIQEGVEQGHYTTGCVCTVES
jgi:hypothetical protein